MSLQHTLPAGAATDPPWRQSISLAASLWDIACRHGLGQSTRSEYRGQLAEVLARYPALAPRPAAEPTAAGAPKASAARTAPAAPGAPGAPTAPGGRRHCGGPR